MKKEKNETRRALETKRLLKNEFNYHFVSLVLNNYYNGNACYNVTTINCETVNLFDIHKTKYSIKCIFIKKKYLNYTFLN